ncbi:hypothetical protein [Delftia sp. RIT313]|uniref:hypothetical protein n=1 Tax=Delftia sp. RIT313 TaxID=1468410 RepID=UPI00044B4324|nr:hypothetical protein [Delftia sp. RIT313]EZP56393.1 hypothetical protein BW39_01706 [Delftia sp. RIT313]
MAKIKILGADRNQFGGARPYGNVTTIRSVLETGATGIPVRSNATAALAVNDVVQINTLQPGFLVEAVSLIVSNGFGIGVTASLGFEYTDGVDRPELPQAANYFGAGIDLATVANLRLNLTKKLAKFPAGVTLLLTITGAAVAEAGYLDLIVHGEGLGAD